MIEIFCWKLEARKSKKRVLMKEKKLFFVFVSTFDWIWIFFRWVTSLVTSSLLFASTSKRTKMSRRGEIISQVGLALCWIGPKLGLEGPDLNSGTSYERWLPGTCVPGPKFRQHVTYKVFLKPLLFSYLILGKQTMKSPLAVQWWWLSW